MTTGQKYLLHLTRGFNYDDAAAGKKVTNGA
jgi:hypothetical protein